MLAALLLTEVVANLNLAVANVALPAIGRAFDASQTGINLVAVAYSLGLAASVLYLGAVGDRYGRKLMLVLGMALSVPACLIAAFAPTIEVLIAGRLLGGIAAGMAYPTTLALITALWSGPARTKSIAMWSAIGGAASALGPLAAGALLLHFDWQSVFLLTLPVAVVALILNMREVPAHVNETTEQVDHISGVISVLFIGAVVVALNFAGSPGRATEALILGGAGVAFGAFFLLRQSRVRNPLFDLHYARRRTFWVAASGGMVVFGSLMGALFVGQQFLQNVLDYSTFEAGLSILPGALMMVLIAPHSATVVERRGSRFTLLSGYLLCLLGFLVMLVLWGEAIPYWPVGLAYALIGAGVGLAGTPASHSLTGSVPVGRVGMASGTADLQRDLGGAIVQSILGTLLTAGYAASVASQIGSSSTTANISASTETQLQKSFAGASAIADQYPQYSTQILEGAKVAFTQGQTWAYTVGMAAIALGALIVWRFFPPHDEELELLAAYAAEDGRQAEAAGQASPG